MAVGNQASVQGINNALSSYSIQMRGVMQTIRDFQQFIVSQGTAGLEAIGFSAADAAAVQQLAGYMSTVAGVYFGTVQQGGSGGTGASQFNFDNALTPLWGGA